MDVCSLPYHRTRNPSPILTGETYPLRGLRFNCNEGCNFGAVTSTSMADRSWPTHFLKKQTYVRSAMMLAIILSVRLPLPESSQDTKLFVDSTLSLRSSGIT